MEHKPTALLCLTCKRSRRTASGNIICTTIGDPALVLRYGNRCRRYQERPSKPSKPSINQPSLFDDETQDTKQ